MPTYHIVPSRDVSKQVKTSHKKWLSSFAKDGSPHKDSAMRKFRDLEENYKDRWDLLMNEI